MIGQWRSADTRQQLTGELGDRIQTAPLANFVKAYSSVGSALMVDPSFEIRPTMFICGNNATAKAQVTKILDQFGWEAADMSTATAARVIEPLARLWLIPGFREDSWKYAFKLLR